MCADVVGVCCVSVEVLAVAVRAGVHGVLSVGRTGGGMDGSPVT